MNIPSWLRPLMQDPSDNASFYLPLVNGLIHVGANRAQERDIYASHNLRVLWIEALPDAFKELQRHIAGTPRQCALQALVTDQDGRRHTFHVSSNQGISSSLFNFAQHDKIWPDIQMVESIQLRGTRLETLLQRESARASDYQALVLDTQGSELLVLRGAGKWLGFFDFIQAEAADFEAYQGGCQLRDLDTFLRPRGFRRVLTVPMIGKPRVGTYYEAIYTRQHITCWRLRFFGQRLRRTLRNRFLHHLPNAQACRRAGLVSELVRSLRALGQRLRHGGPPRLLPICVH